jgi:phosphate starvation-inducible PhoH-like protein
MKQPDWMDLRDKDVIGRLTAARKRVQPLTPNHGAYLKAIDEAKCVLCTGPAGTGKTFMAAAKAVEMLRAGRVKRVVLTRPLQEAGESPGFIPGDLWDKTVDMMVPLIESLEEFLAPGEFDELRKAGAILVVPLAKMRGRTMKGAFTILDEAQNATFKQLEMFLTRLGADSKMVVCGDHTQSDLPYHSANSLWEVVEAFRPDCHKDIRVVELGEADIVRSEIVRWVVNRLTNRRGGGYYQVSGRHPLRCPACDRASAYEADALLGHSVVECFHCRAQVELLDHAGNLDPAVVRGGGLVSDPYVTLPH